MKCTICKHGETATGTATVTLERAGSLIVIRGVPADVCEDCGEYYLDKATTERVLAVAEEAVRRNVETEIVRFAA